VPTRLVLNKADRLDPAALVALRREYAHEEAIVMSAHDPADVASLRQAVIDFFDAAMVEGELIVPYARQDRLGEVYELTRVVGEEYDELGARLRVRGLPAAIDRLRQRFGER
jgi:GTP-binding protein HflX